MTDNTDKKTASKRVVAAGLAATLVATALPMAVHADEGVISKMVSAVLDKITSEATGTISAFNSRFR